MYIRVHVFRVELPMLQFNRGPGILLRTGLIRTIHAAPIFLHKHLYSWQGQALFKLVSCRKYLHCSMSTYHINKRPNHVMAYQAILDVGAIIYGYFRQCVKIQHFLHT